MSGFWADPAQLPTSNRNGIPSIVSMMCESFDLEMILLVVAAARLVAAMMEGVNVSA